MAVHLKSESMPHLLPGDVVFLFPIMAKDPAFLFFPGDWLGGTQTLTRLHKGAYMDLLMAQFNNGHLSIEDIEFILGKDDFKALWPKLKTKFKPDINGLFFNQKLENEIVKRKKHSEHQSINSHKRWDKNGISQNDPKTIPLGNGNENGIGNKDEIENDSFGKSENLLGNNGTLISQMHDLWKGSFPSYTDDIRHDYPACKSIADFIFKNGKISNGYGNNDAEIKVLNTMQLIADQVNREPFWVNKPLKSIASNIQEFYNKIKNPINGSGYKQAAGKQINEDRLKQKLAERDPSRR